MRMRRGLGRAYRIFAGIVAILVLAAGVFLGYWFGRGAGGGGVRMNGDAGGALAPESAGMPAGPDQKPVPMRFSREGNRVQIDLYAEERNIEVEKGVRLHMWTFDGTVPGPVLYLQQGDQVTLRLHNIDPHMVHSIDLHAAMTAPNVSFADVPPGQTKTIHFVAAVPGVFMYHCAAMPMAVHIAEGMYGAVVVTPRGQEPPNYTIVQSEIYPGGNFEANPLFVAFNGRPGQYAAHPLSAQVGKPLRIAFVNAGPNLFSAFHIVGTVIADAQASGNPRNNLYDVQTVTVAPGDGAMFTVRFAEPGLYPFLSHDMLEYSEGAAGLIRVNR